MTIRQEVFDDVRKDRDLWRNRAKHAEARLRDLEAEVANMRRQHANAARERAHFDAVFGRI